MTEKTNRGVTLPHWPERSMDRGVSPSPREIEPHPEYGDLPPCDDAILTDRPCPRPATVHYGYNYYCADHAEQALAMHEADDKQLAITFTKRFLWTARGWSFERLEYHLGNALVEYEEALGETKRRAEAAEKRAENV